MITRQDFEKVEMRVGTIVAVEGFPEARNPAYKLKVDLGAYGIRKSSAQITKLYKKEELGGRQVIVVVNFAPKQIANFSSECLVMGVVGNDKDIILLQPERKVENGLRIG